MLANGLKKRRIDISTRQLFAAVIEIPKNSLIDARIGIWIREVRFRRQFQSDTLKNLFSGADYSLFPDSHILTPDLRAQKKQPDVADNLIEAPKAILSLKMISQRTIAARTPPRNRMNEVRMHLLVIPLFSETVYRNIVEVLASH
jgi:hypothetical protein